MTRVSRVTYVPEPPDTYITYTQRGKQIRLTWKRNIGGGVGPKEHESLDDYVRRRLHGAVTKREVTALVDILQGLEQSYARA